MSQPCCRSCHASEGQVVLDLGMQPASDYFPAQHVPAPDPTYPLQMWLCACCGLAQLLSDPTVPEEPRGAEPAALVEPAVDAVSKVAAAGWLQSGMGVVEYGSPHGGSWVPLLEERGLSRVPDGGRADVVLDSFGLMHEPRQDAALAHRVARLAPRGALLLQYHSLATILRLGQWNSLRHGHYAYYSTAAVVEMLARVGFTAKLAWQFDLYGGTVLLASTRAHASDSQAGESVRRLLDTEQGLGVRDPQRFRDLQRSVARRARALREWLVRQRSEGATVIGYGAASRAISLLCHARVDSRLLSAVADASQAKQGRRMPGTDIPVISPGEVVARRPDLVLLLLPDLLREVRTGLPEIEDHGGYWVSVDDVT